MPHPLTGGLLGPLLAIAALLSCGPGGTPSAAPAAAPAAAAPAPPTEAAPPTPLHQFELPMASQNATMLPFWVAAEQGIFRRHGLDVTLVNLPPSTASQALQSGSVPGAATGGSTVTAYVGGATELVYVGGVSNKAPYRVVVRPDILRMEDLRGRSIGLGAPGASPAVAMLELVRHYGLEPDRDVTFTYLRDSSATVAALLSGSIDGIVM